MARRSLFLGLALVALLALFRRRRARCCSGTNGRIVLISGPAFGNTQLFLRSVTSSTGGGSMTGPLATGLAQQHRHPTWSPDRTKIAFAEGPGVRPFDIYIARPHHAGGDSRRTSRIPPASRRPPGVVARRHTHRVRERQRHHRPPPGRRRRPQPDHHAHSQGVEGGLEPRLADALLLGRGHHAGAERHQQRHQALPAAGEQLERGDRAAPRAAAPMCSSPRSHPTGRSSVTRSAPRAGNSTSASVLAASAERARRVHPDRGSGAGDYNCTWSPDGT